MRHTWMVRLVVGMAVLLLVASVVFAFAQNRT